MVALDLNRAFQVFQEIAFALRTRRSQKEVLNEVLHILERLLGLKRSTIMLVGMETGDLISEVTPDEESPSPETRYQKGEGITGEVLRTGQSAIIPRISDEPRFQGRIHYRDKVESDALSFICVPIALDEEVVGTLSVDLPCMPQEALDDYMATLNIVACMIANNVNARRIAKRDQQSLEAENFRLREVLGADFRPSNMVGRTQIMENVYQRIHLVAPSNTSVLIRGESGTGKELVASAIHYMSERSSRPFVVVNCAQLSESLLESELFGHERGAFTGATSFRHGRIEEAEGGTLFFDEIGDFSLPIQVKLLRVLQEREYQRVGSNRTHKADIRIICATNRNLEVAVEKGEFRQDLYYRIHVFPIHLPALRERRADIPVLADHFAEKLGARMGKPVHRISTAAINMLLAYHWPGNIRELENCIEHALLLSKDGVIHSQDLPPTLQMPRTHVAQAKGSTLKSRIQVLEKDLIIDALKRHNGRVASAAKELGLTGRMIRYKMKNLSIDNKDYVLSQDS